MPFRSESVRQAERIVPPRYAIRPAWFHEGKMREDLPGETKSCGSSVSSSARATAV